MLGLKLNHASKRGPRHQCDSEIKRLWICSKSVSKPSCLLTETEMSSRWRHCRHWLHRKLEDNTNFHYLFCILLKQPLDRVSWWRHQMEHLSALMAICAGHSPVPDELPSQRPVTRSFDVFFDLRLNKRLSKQPWGWWFETLTHPLWRHRNV